MFKEMRVKMGKKNIIAQKANKINEPMKQD